MLTATKHTEAKHDTFITLKSSLEAHILSIKVTT